MRNLLTKNMHTTRTRVSCTSISFYIIFFTLRNSFFLLTLFLNYISCISFYCELVFFSPSKLTYLTARKSDNIATCTDNRNIITYYVFGMSTLRSSKTLLLTERLSFLKGYQNGSSINADPLGFRVKLFMFSSS